MLAVLGVVLVLRCSILKRGGCKASDKSRSSRAYKKKRCCSVVNMSRNVNDLGRFNKVKTRLTTKKEEESK